MRGKPGLNQRSKTNWENHELKTGFLRISIYWLNLKLASLIRKKKKGEKIQITNIRNERGYITTTNIKNNEYVMNSFMPVYLKTFGIYNFVKLI